VFFMPPSDESHAPRKSGRDLKTTHRSSPAGLKVVPSPSQVIEQVSEERLRALIAEVVRPLHAEVTNLREKMARPEAQRSQFEVSLSYIPPEVEEKIWLRLQQDLGAQALRHASEQTEQVLGDAKSTIDHKIASAEGTFRRQLTQELEGVEARARGLSEQIEQAINDRLHTSSEKLQQQASQAGSHLAMRSEEFFHSLQHRLTDEHATRLQEIEQVQTAIDAESSRQQDRVGDLSSRIGRLDEVARRLETDFDNRLAQTSNDVISKTRTQLESNAALIMNQMETRNAARLEHQLDAACGRLKVAEQEIEASVADAMRVHTEETLRSFEQAMDELAGHAVGRWRRALARDLGSVARILGDEVRMEIGAEGSGRQ
jgi:hypothetical protein